MRVNCIRNNVNFGKIEYKAAEKALADASSNADKMAVRQEIYNQYCNIYSDIKLTEDGDYKVGRRRSTRPENVQYPMFFGTYATFEKAAEKANAMESSIKGYTSALCKDHTVSSDIILGNFTYNKK